MDRVGRTKVPWRAGFRDAVGTGKRERCEREKVRRLARWRTLSTSHSRTLYSGMFPCFFFGSASTLLRSMRRAWMILMRVSDGRITSSTKPRAAAS